MSSEHLERHSPHAKMGRIHYRHLLLMAVLSFMSMFVLMYAMVNAFANVDVNANQFYMAGLMTGPMVLIELAVNRCRPAAPVAGHCLIHVSPASPNCQCGFVRPVASSEAHAF